MVWCSRTQSLACSTTQPSYVVPLHPPVPGASPQVAGGQTRAAVPPTAGAPAAQGDHGRREDWQRVPDIFARHRVTVHVPRRPYARALPGIPTIRVFEALACGIPLVCAPWRDSENLFRPGKDYLIAADEAAMERHLAALRDDLDLRRSLAASGLQTIRARHTCAHRARELIDILHGLRASAPMEASA